MADAFIVIFLPPRTPYTKVSDSILGQNALRNKLPEYIIAPVADTTRQPYSVTRALTNGPTRKQ